MIVEVVAVGTELLLGQIVNSNGAFIGERLARDGFDVNYQVTVGDNLDRLASTIRSAVARSGAVILTGGIGPTQDDLTREALCSVAGVGMRRDEAHADAIRERLMRLRGSVPENTLRMADHPATAEPLPNRAGVALGIAMEIEGVQVYAVPGVPSEMSTMIDEQVLPRLRAASGEPAVVRSRVLRTWGLGESAVSEMLDDLYESTNPSVAFLITDSEVKVRITAKAESVSAADEMIDGFDAAVTERLGGIVFGRDDETVESLIVARLAQLGWTVATVEQATLGAVGARLAEADEARTGGGSSQARPVHRPVYRGTRVVPRGTDVDVADALGSFGEIADAADVVVAVGLIDGPALDANTTRSVGVAVRTRHGESRETIGVLGGDDRARRFAVVGALHVLRKALVGRATG